MTTAADPAVPTPPDDPTRPAPDPDPAGGASAPRGEPAPALLDEPAPALLDQPAPPGADDDWSAAAVLDVAARERRGARGTVAAHPWATGAMAAVLAAGLGFGGGYLTGSASTSNDVPGGVVDGGFPGGDGGQGGQGLGGGVRPDRGPLPVDQGGPVAPGDGTGGTGTDSGGVTDGSTT